MGRRKGWVPVRLFCGFLGVCADQSFRGRTVRVEGTPVHIPYCTRNSGCSLAFWGIKEAVEARKRQAKEKGLRLCPKCLEWHL